MSTVFAAVTDEGKVNVYDLHASKQEPLCEQKVVKKHKCNRVVFASHAPLLLVGDSAGAVTSLKLSPNLRRITPLPASLVGGNWPAAAIFLIRLPDTFCAMVKKTSTKKRFDH